MQDQEILKAALVGLEVERLRVNALMEQVIRAMGLKPKGKRSGKSAAPKRKMSAAGRAAIKAGQKKRWAEFHKKQKKAGKK